MKFFKQILLIFSHAASGGVIFLAAFIAADFYFIPLFNPGLECPGTDKAVAINAAGDQVRMKDQTCGWLPRVRTVSLYVRKNGDDQGVRILSYAPDGAIPHVVWTSPHRVSVALSSAHAIHEIGGSAADTMIDYDIGRVVP